MVTLKNIMPYKVVKAVYVIFKCINAFVAHKRVGTPFSFSGN